MNDSLDEAFQPGWLGLERFFLWGCVFVVIGWDGSQFGGWLTGRSEVSFVFSISVPLSPPLSENADRDGELDVGV